jgi:hypothetical protein
MRQPAGDWILLFYTLPTQPSRLRLQIWRSLQKLGAVHLHNGAWTLPSMPELLDRVASVAAEIQELGGSCQVMLASSYLPGGEEQIVALFRESADIRADEILERLESISARLDQAADIGDGNGVENELRRERTAYLHARRIAYFGSNRDSAVADKLAELRGKLDELFRSAS